MGRETLHLSRPQPPQAGSLDTWITGIRGVRGGSGLLCLREEGFKGNRPGVWAPFLRKRHEVDCILPSLVNILVGAEWALGCLRQR